MKNPIKNCYWVVPDRFLAGEYPGDLHDLTPNTKIESLLDAGITCFIDLTAEEDGLDPYYQLLEQRSDLSVQYKRFSIANYSIPTSREQTVTILDEIDRILESSGKVYIHCWGGIGRTGTMVGCWLSRHGYPGAKALEQLGKLWKQCPKSRRLKSPETSEQEQYITNWSE
ncbi:dual specificity protein phosphatase family protein [bacterium]|nr:dual specificity protein phosphatase family protein [bacterium]